MPCVPSHPVSRSSPELEKVACQSSAIALGLIRQTHPTETTSGRFGLARRFATRLDNRECKGLSALPEADKDQIRDLAKREEEGRRGQSEAGQACRRGAGIAEPTTRDRTRNAVDLAYRRCNTVTTRMAVNSHPRQTPLLGAPNPTFSTGGGSRPERRIDTTVRPKGLHYKWAWSRQCTSWPAAVIRGGGWGGRVRPSRSSKSRWSGLGSV